MVKDSKSLIFQEFNTPERTNWFDLKQKKFLHTIDTFYYSVKLKHSFLKDTLDPACLAFRKFSQDAHSCLELPGDFIPFACPGLREELNITMQRYKTFYNFHLTCPQLYDIFIAEAVPNTNTSQIIVQIRSELLWQYGVTKAFEHTYRTLKAVCAFFGFEIWETIENRTDFCWHSNYHQRPEHFFKIDNISSRYVSTLGRRAREEGNAIIMCAMMYPDGSYDHDYMALGNRGEKCFLRIYNKTKECIQMQHKAWFFKEWLFNGLINRYDYYIYEECYKNHSFSYQYKARLKFYLEHGKDQRIKKDIRAILDGVAKPAKETVRKLAEKLTPRITIITNVEFQVMRKMSRSFKTLPLHDNSAKKEAKRIYDFLDMRYQICRCLTTDVFRLVDRTDSNKSRCETCAFWAALQRTKFVDVKKPKQEIKLQRDYARRLDAEVIKRRAMSAAVSYSLYMKGVNELSPYEDAAELFCILNDNDVEYMSQCKRRRGMQLNSLLYDGPVEQYRPLQRNIKVIDGDTGEVLL